MDKLIKVGATKGREGKLMETEFMRGKTMNRKQRKKMKRYRQKNGKLTPYFVKGSLR